MLLSKIPYPTSKTCLFSKLQLCSPPRHQNKAGKIAFLHDRHVRNKYFIDIYKEKKIPVHSPWGLKGETQAQHTPVLLCGSKCVKGMLKATWITLHKEAYAENHVKVQQAGLWSLNEGSLCGLCNSCLGRLGFLCLFLIKEVSLDSLKMDGTHVENCIYST